MHRQFHLSNRKLVRCCNLKDSACGWWTGSSVTVVASNFLSPLRLLLYTLRVERERASVIICLSESVDRLLETQQSNAIRHQQWKPKERCLKESVRLTQSRSASTLSVFPHCRHGLLSTVMTDLRSAFTGAHATTERQLDDPILLAALGRSPPARPSDCQEGRQLFAHWRLG